MFPALLLIMLFLFSWEANAKPSGLKCIRLTLEKALPAEREELVPYT